MTMEMIKAKYEQLFSNYSYFEISDKLLTMENDENVDGYRRLMCNELLYIISVGDVKYKKKVLEKNVFVDLICKNIKYLPVSDMYYRAVDSFFERDSNKLIYTIEKMVERDYNDYKDQISKPEDFFNEIGLIDMYFEPFKDAYVGFWTDLAKIYRKYPCQKELPELCEVIEAYYRSKTDDEALELLLDSIQKYPQFVLLKELAAYTYYSLKMWNNALAYFEALEDSAVFFRKYDLYFMMAWCHGKLKNYKKEEFFYRKSLELAPDILNSINNLGYCMYKQKRYLEALPLFEKCLEIDKNVTYVVNNYVRVLVALGRNKDAKDFVRKSNGKVSKDIVERVKKLDNTNARLKKVKTKIQTQIIDEEDIYNKDSIASIDLGIKREQFSNEKLLEDELTARIESGIDVFGLKLKMYRRKGVYGRQYIFPMGRLDLLCEDVNGDLYIIELKKDAGYGDVYKQVSKYLDWFEKDKIAQGKKVYGIICLNSPSKELIEKVHKDERIRIFEYQISYTEL